MTKFLFIVFASILGVSAMAQVLAYSHLSHQRDKAMIAPMHVSESVPVSLETTADSTSSVPATPAPVTIPVQLPQVPVQEQWSPAMVILVVTSIISSLGGLVTLIVTALTKSKVEIMRESSVRRDEKVENIHTELRRNTSATEKAVAAVEEVERKLPIKQSESGEEEEQ